MTERNESALGESVELFAGLVTRLAKGLETRVEGGIETTTPDRAPANQEAIAALANEGTLMARTAWKGEDGPGSGCFLWYGELGALLGGTDQPVRELREEEITTLDQSLRLNVEEGGEGDLPLDWSELELVTPENAAEKLREAGVPESGEGLRVTLRIAERELTFLFCEASSAAAGDAPSIPEQEVATGDAGSAATASSGPEPDPDPEHLRHLLDLRMPLTIRLGSAHLSLEEVLQLAPGSIVELDEREDEPLEVLANGTVIARGEVVVVDERFGLRITEVGSSASRVGAAT